MLSSPNSVELEEPAQMSKSRGEQRQQSELELKVKNLNSQLYYMMQENDTLKEEIARLQASLSHTENEEIAALREDISRLTEERNQTAK
jgi:peptidoglycan hydrolase CwlO-like protein